MQRTRTSRRSFLRRAFGLPDVFWILFFILLLIAILLPSLSRTREITKRAVCASNLRGIGQAMKIYANDNVDWFPRHYFEANKDPGGPPFNHGITWAGTMGSNDLLRISEATSADTSPKKSHPSRSLFMLLIDGSCAPEHFVCPSSGDVKDDLRNRGPDASGATRDVASMCGSNRFDFRGYSCLSYGYQLPYGPRAMPNEALDTRVAILADKGPYYEAGGEGLPGSDTVRDQRSAVAAPAAGEPNEILRRPNDTWSAYNSRNHNREGQNVVYVDGHVSFEKRPIVGVSFDNIYTIQTGYTVADTLAGMVPDAKQTIGPLTNTDSFIVP